MKSIFRIFADKTAELTGSSWAFFLMVVLTAVWFAAGPAFHFSDTWQLTMNTFASQVTFLVAFLLQNTQNRDTQALQLKLDELIRATRGARNTLLDLERMSDEELARLKDEFERLSRSRSGRP
ncbi:MAG TPA: low affinity iron permease family protein [Thermoanaerobaculia bacterium]